MYLFFSINEYLYLLDFLIFLLFFVILLLLLSNLLTVSKSFDVEKNSPYECGFNPFEDAREPFEIQFYLVAILFIIFDLEISFLIPWIIVFRFCGIFSFSIVLVFLVILTIGFVYELYKGALQWT